MPSERVAQRRYARKGLLPWSNDLGFGHGFYTRLTRLQRKLFPPIRHSELPDSGIMEALLQPHEKPPAYPSRRTGVTRDKLEHSGPRIFASLSGSHAVLIAHYPTAGMPIL